MTQHGLSVHLRSPFNQCQEITPVVSSTIPPNSSSNTIRMCLPGSRFYTNVGIHQQNEFTPFGESAAGHTFERYDTIQNPNTAFLDYYEHDQLPNDDIDDFDLESLSSIDHVFLDEHMPVETEQEEHN